MRTAIEFEVEPDLQGFNAAKALLKERPLAGMSELMRLTEQGSLLSMLEIGRARFMGVGAPKDYSAAEEWFRRAADARSFLGHYYLGLLQRKTGRPVDAVASLNFAAVRGYGPALYELGKMYFHGLGVEKDLSLAAQYLEKASGAGMVHAQALLAHIAIRAAPNFMGKVWGFLRLFAAIVRGVFLTLKEDRNDQRLIR